MRNRSGMAEWILVFRLLLVPWIGQAFSIDTRSTRSSKRDDLQELDPETQASSRCVGSNGKRGRCKYFRDCFSNEYASNIALAINYTCPIDRTYVGVCCENGREGTRERSVGEWNLAEILPLISVNVDDGIVVDNATRIVWSDERENASMSRPREPVRSRGCGTTFESRSRLVGGRPADPTEWPWMAALLRKDRSQYCGGVLITDRHVLTAAHCVYSAARLDVTVRLGEYDFAIAEETRALDFAVSEIRVHRDFDPTTYANDIAMIEMHRPTVFDSYVWPVCLPPIGETFENKSAVVTGWGTKYYGGPASTVLMEVGVPIWPQDKCVRSFVRPVPGTTMCAGAQEGGRDACQGDSGGPLLHQLGNGRWVNVGIVSWGIRCGEPGRPGVYTRVTSYLEWILENAVF